MEPILSVEGMTKIFGSDCDNVLCLLDSGLEKDEIFRQTGSTVGAYDVSFSVNQGETFVIIGLSGSGKSTVIRCLNLLLEPNSGRICFNGRDVTQYSKTELMNFRRNNIAMVFQSFGLLNHRNVLKNVAFGLEIRGVDRRERFEKAKRAISLVGLAEQEQRSIHSLSGGMKQRVGLARALANDPDILLMDEPFSALDPIVRSDMQTELLKIQKLVRKTIVFITHDINEAFKLGDKIAIMRNGRIVQQGSPEEILFHPVDEYVRSFIKSIDKGKALSAWHIWQKPESFMILKEPFADLELQQISSSGYPFAFVLDHEERLQKILHVQRDPASTKLTVSELPLATVTLETTLQDMLPLIESREFNNPIGLTDSEGRFVGYTTGRLLLSALK